MSHHNVEIKARCADLPAVARRLTELGARRVGLDQQVDTYFPCAGGRLKLREGTIERALIHYRRPDQTGPKDCQVTMTRLPGDVALKPVLSAALGVLIEVVKEREIWFLDNVKIHLDRLAGLGEFVEIEAIDEAGTMGHDHLYDQCRAMMTWLDLADVDLLPASYSDMLLSDE